MGSFQHTPQNSKHTQFFSKMKVQFILAACLAAAAFAAPIDNFVDPDCIEEDLAVEEPASEIEAEFALGVPDMFIKKGLDNVVADEDCVEEFEPTEPQVEAATEECEDPIETTPEPAAQPTEAECVDEPIETTTEAAPEPETTAPECVDETTEAAPADECEDEGNEVAPALDMRIEAAPAVVVEDIKFYGEENMIPDIEECEE